MIRLCCRRIPLDADVDVDALALRMDGFTGADIESVCKKTTLLALAEFQNEARSAPFSVGSNDFEAVITEVRAGSAAAG